MDQDKKAPKKPLTMFSLSVGYRMAKPGGNDEQDVRQLLNPFVVMASPLFTEYEAGSARIV